MSRPSAYIEMRRRRELQIAHARVIAEGEAPTGELAESIAECATLSGFIRAAWEVIEPGTDYMHNWHIDAISEHLEAVTAGQCRRLLINMPPRYMKSIACSIMWPIWEWTRRAETRFMFTTYAGALSEDHAIKRLTILQSDWFRERWGSKVTLTKENVSTVINSALGVYEATSFSGTATGKGANRLVVDDPHNPKKADSDVERATTLRLFNTTFQSRLNNKKQDAIVVVMQRLHEEDVSARCLELGYTHLCLPAESEGRTVISLPSGREIVRQDKELLWPEREGHAEVDAMRIVMGPYGFAGQYQQRPTPDGGGIFTTFPVVDAVPAKAYRVRYWDKAGTDEGGDFTAGVLMALADGVFYIEDIVHGQWSASAREKIIKDTASSDGIHVHVWFEQEPGSAGKESAENSRKMLAGYITEQEVASGKKVTRARPLAGQAQISNVKLLRADWNRKFVSECQAFPNGRHDDMVDAAAGAFNKLALALRPAKTVAAKAPPLVPIPTGTPRGGIPSAIRR